MPFEKRIRIKYMLFGLVSGMSIVGVLALIETISLIVMNMIVPIDAYMIKLKGVIPFSIYALFVPLAYWLWHSRAKPRNHPELDETVGLKTDYDKVKGLLR